MSGSIRMKAHVVTKIEIAAKPTDVFAYLQHLKLHKLWNPHMQGTLPDITLEAGMEYHVSSLLFGKKFHSNNQVTKLVAGKELEICNETGMVEYCIRYRLRPQAEGTLLTCSSTVSSESRSFAFAKPILKLLAQRELHIDLQLLKTAVEQQLK